MFIEFADQLVNSNYILRIYFDLAKEEIKHPRPYFLVIEMIDVKYEANMGRLFENFDTYEACMERHDDLTDSLSVKSSLFNQKTNEELEFEILDRFLGHPSIADMDVNNYEPKPYSINKISKQFGVSNTAVIEIFMRYLQRRIEFIANEVKPESPNKKT